MLVVEQPLQKIINAKNKFIDGLLVDFEAQFGQMSSALVKEINALFKFGVFDYETVLAVFEANGFDEMVESFVEQYSGVMQFVKAEASYMGVEFALTEKGLDFAALLQEQNIATLLKTKELYAQQIIEAGVKSRVEEKTTKEILESLQGNLDSLWRNYKLETSEGIKIFDRYVHSEQMKAAGIERFVYVGPDDDRTREECAEVLHDPRQATGWTREDIDASPVSFVGGGGWNCRHDWYPFIEEIE